MFDSKSPLLKVVSYTITGFFVLIIVISFGMPDFISRMGLDQSVVAVVNGEKVGRVDFARYRDNRFGAMRADPKMDGMILNEYINHVLMLQHAHEEGFYVTDESLKESILQMPALRDPETGRVNAERLNYFLERVNISFNDLQKIIRKDMLRERFIKAFRMGVAIPSEEVKAEYVAKNSRIQIKYSFLSLMDMQNMYRAQTEVTDGDIAAEMAKNKEEVKDPKTDRERIRKKIESAKISSIKKNTIEKVNEIAIRGGSFDEAQAVLKGRVAVSKVFPIGGKPTDAKGQPISSIANSKIFLEDFMEIGVNRSSRAIIAESGIYIFTPVMKNLRNETPSEKDYNAIADNLREESMRMIAKNVMEKLYEKAKIIKNLKTD
ncbi:MAG: SurA N-terminal domain-containing protein [Spirochaetes bacterium]|nr:SurA N-terminal domain-containing protein [Spirochaetota bacterium]